MILSINPTSQNAILTKGTSDQQLQSFNLFVQPGTTVSVEYQFQNTQVNWLEAYVSAFNGNTAIVEVFLVNGNLLTEANYTAKILLKDENELYNIHTVNLSITEPLYKIKTEKPNYDMVYNRISNTLSGNNLVNILHNTNSEQLTFETVGTLFLEKTAIDNFTLVEDPAFPFSTNSELPQTGSKVVTCRLRKSNGQIATSFTVTVQVINTNDISVNPAVLNFSLYKHLAEEKSSILQINNPANRNYTISGPDFVTFSAISGNSSDDVTVTTKNSVDLLAQLYTGEIVVTYDSKTVKIPVTVNNIDFVDLKLNDYNFCLDQFILTVKRMTETGKIVRIGLEINIESAERNVTVNPVYQIAYYNDQAQTDVGKKIHNHFPVFSKHIFGNPGVEFNNVFIYKPADVTITIEELNSNYEVLFTRKIENIKLYPGKKPKMFPAFTNSNLKRIYADSAHLFSYVTSLVDPSDIVGKAVSNNPFSTGEVNSIYFEDSENLMYFGDYKNVLGIDFLRAPKGHQQIFYQYINENLVPELFVFNGDYLIDDTYEHTYDDVEFNAKKYDAKIIGKLTLNTGFVFKEETAALSQLNKRNLGFVKIGEEILKVFPITSKYRRADSSVNVKNDEFEFLIVEDGN
ncbi:hypothetical protein [Chryseobacterium terrae]|uniref:Cadherin domain-containing protein n=1 Tax=Chryseobacterium terrae TaxID=3163299 RepID=A0ABW8Y5G9_9FLAO